jgi:hypothetical protein
MFSILNPSIVYTNISEEIFDHDYNFVADGWDMDGREVYRGNRDPHYTHANVYWLYDENLKRVGCAEHSLEDHGNFRLLWFRDDPFSTLLQEKWSSSEDIWSQLPRHVFEKFLAEGWTTPARFLEHCLQGPLRIVTPQMILSMPKIYACDKCGRRSLSSFPCGTERPLDFPDKSKIWFVNDEMMLFTPPTSTRVWSTVRLTLPPDDDSSHPSAVPEQAQVPEQEQAQAP